MPRSLHCVPRKARHSGRDDTDEERALARSFEAQGERDYTSIDVEVARAEVWMSECRLVSLGGFSICDLDVPNRYFSGYFYMSVI